MGDLTFVASELIIREIEARSEDSEYLIFDFSRVSSIDKSACRIFLDITQRYLSEQRTTLFVGVSKKYRFSNYLKTGLREAAQDEMLAFNDIDRALEWCEDALFNQSVGESQLPSELPLQDLPLCENLSQAELDLLDSLLTDKEYAEGEIICQEGAPADLVYFLISGKVSAWINIESKSGTWLGGSSQGGVFGESALLGNKVRSADVVADSNVLVKELVAEHLMQRDDEVAESLKQNLFRNLSILYDMKVRRATAQIRTLSR